MTIDAKAFRPKFMQQRLLELEHNRSRTCRMCPTKLTYQRYYCSSMCVSRAKMEGSFVTRDRVPC